MNRLRQANIDVFSFQCFHPCFSIPRVSQLKLIVVLATASTSTQMTARVRLFASTTLRTHFLLINPPLFYKNLCYTDLLKQKATTNNRFRKNNITVHRKINVFFIIKRLLRNYDICPRSSVCVETIPKK